MTQMIKTALLLAAIFAGAVAAAPPDPQARRILDKLAERYQAMAGIRVEFIQKLVNPAYLINETREGTILIEGDKFHILFEDMEIFNDGQNVWTYQKEVDEVVVNLYVPEDEEISFLNIWDIYREGFDYHLLKAPPGGNREIHLIPQDPEATYQRVEIVATPTHELSAFRIVEKNQNVYSWIVGDIREKKGIPPGEFVFNPADYPDVEVVDLR